MKIISPTFLSYINLMILQMQEMNIRNRCKIVNSVPQTYSTTHQDPCCSSILKITFLPWFYIPCSLLNPNVYWWNQWLNFRCTANREFQSSPEGKKFLRTSFLNGLPFIFRLWSLVVDSSTRRNIPPFLSLEPSKKCDHFIDVILSFYHTAKKKVQLT